MVVLNLTVTVVSYRFFSNGLYGFLIDFTIWVRDFTLIFAVVTVLDALLYILFRKHKSIHNILKYSFLLVNICLFLTDLFTIYFFKFQFNVAMMEILAVSNIREGFEFASMYFFDPKFYMLIVAVVVFLLICFYMFRALYKHKVLMLVIIFICTGLGVAGILREVALKRGLFRVWRSIAVFRLVYLASETMNNIYSFNAAVSNPDDINITKNDKTIPYAVFILGESTGRKHLGLYGYELDATPLLNARAQHERLYVFDDVISSNGHTIASMRTLFSLYANDSAGQWFKYTSLFNILNKAGYKTFWLTNQERRPGTDPRNIYSNQCSYKDFTDFKTEAFENGSYDESLVDLLDKAMNYSDEYNFFVLHMLGTHGKYIQRYPAQYEKFSTNDEITPLVTTKKQKATRAQYDNAVLYNDFVIDKIISRFEDKNAIVIYISDHGEDVYDGGSIFGHGEGTDDHYVLEIPMIIWLSQKFSDSYPELERRIASSVHRPYMTDDMLHTLLDILSIETDEYDPKKSIINPEFDASRPRIHAGRFIYNKDTGLNAIH